MQEKVHPAIIAVSFVLLALVLVFYWRHTMAEPKHAIGFITVNGVTREMTVQEGINMGLAMQGKLRRPAGAGSASQPGARHGAPAAH